MLPPTVVPNMLQGANHFPLLPRPELFRKLRKPTTLVIPRYIKKRKQRKMNILQNFFFFWLFLFGNSTAISNKDRTHTISELKPTKANQWMVISSGTSIPKSPNNAHFTAYQFKIHQSLWLTVGLVLLLSAISKHAPDISI